MHQVNIRPARAADRAALHALRAALWPNAPTEELLSELDAILSSKVPGALPLVNFVAEADDGSLVGFIEVGLRSHAEGCDPARAAGYVEGWSVAPAHQRRGIGRQLLRAAEDWAREQGCVELASDTWIDNALSQRVHEALGFREVERAIHFRKALR
jgi:aminoglycoside 6'-N-acetyltransferase I